MGKEVFVEKKKILIFDTTLRDGEQSPGIALNEMEKVQIAQQLEKLGVDVIEAGFPVASQGDFDAVHAVAQAVTKSTVCGLSRTAYKDLDRCWEAIEPAPHRRIHTFIATSEIHMRKKLQMTPEQVKKETAAAVTRARSYTDDVEFSPEDASRSDFDFMCEVLQIAVDSGATTINIPDTVGFATPTEFRNKIKKISETVKGNYVLSVHCHNDLGLAVANSLEAVRAGAQQIECTINGIGERAGNAAMEEIVMALRTRPEEYQHCHTNIDTTQIAKTSRLVSRLTGYPVQYNKAVVGRNAFAHESGIHQHGVLKERETYEIMNPEEVGMGESQIVLGKHSGRHAFKKKLEDLGHQLQGSALNEAFDKFKELADRKQNLTERDLEALAANIPVAANTDRFSLVNLSCSGGSTTDYTATVTLEDRTGNSGDQHTKTVTAVGDGMVAAACNAVRQIVGFDCEVTDYTVNSVTGGVDALADVALRLRIGDFSHPGRGISTDVVEASVEAFVDALNRMGSSDPDGLTVLRPGSLDGLR